MHNLKQDRGELSLKDDFYEKLKLLLDFVEQESKKPSENESYAALVWNKGYRNAMIKVRDYIWKLFN